MPAKAPLEPAHEWLRKPAKRDRLLVAVLHVVADDIRKDVIDKHLFDLEPRFLEQLGSRPRCIRVRHRAAGLRFGVARDGLIESPERTVGFLKQYGEHLPRPPVIDHQLHRTARSHVVGSDLFKYPLGMRRVMDDAKGIDQIVWRSRNELGQSFAIRFDKLDTVLQTKDLRTLPREFERSA